MGRRSFSLAAALMLIVSPVASADPHDLYRAGLRSFEFGYWREALVFFEAAAEEEPREGASVREYGMWKTPYLPHFYRGAALFSLGHYAQALEALAESEAQGAVRRRKNRVHYQRILELRDEIRKAIEREVGRLHRGAATDYETLGALRESPVLARHEVVATVPEIGEIDRILKSTTSSLNDESLLTAATQLQRAMGLLDQARDGIETFARSVHQRELELEEEKRRVAEQARRNQVLAETLQARDLIAGNGCQPRAIELLEGVERHEGLGRSEVGGEEANEVDLLLARAHLQCEHLSLAKEYLRRAGDRGRPQASLSPEGGQGNQLRVLARAITARQRQQQTAGGDPSASAEALVAGLSDYLLAAALAGEADCQELEVTRWIERARERLGPGGDPAVTKPSLPASLPFRYTPYLILARAHGNCRDRRGVETYRDLARGLGRASPAELSELDAWLAANPELEPYSGSYALLVGAYDYRLASGWPALYKPGEDVRQIRRALEAHGFQVETLVNPTSRELEGSLADFFVEHGTERSHRLVFYYAGHGHTESTEHGIKLGYIVPVDAGDPRQDRANLKRLIGMERFREFARGSNANDLLFMFDSCFAGTVFQATRSCLPPDCAPPAAGPLSVREQVSRPVRMFLTAGGENQMVPDESVFRRMVTRALDGEADGDRDGIILGSELGSFVQSMTLSERMSQPAGLETSLLALHGREPAEPQWGRLAEGEFGLGDILFHAPETERPPGRGVTERRGEIATELAYWAAARRSLDPEAVRRYLERFPGGRFAPLAQWILERSDDAPAAASPSR